MNKKSKKEKMEDIFNSKNKNTAFFIISSNGDAGKEVTKEEFKKWLYNKKEKKEDNNA